MSKPTKEAPFSPKDLTHNPLVHSIFDRRDQELEKPVVFRESFNHVEHINLSQAWSLWITGGRDDGRLGINPAAGWLFTLSITAGLMLVMLQRLLPGFPQDYSLFR